MKRILCVVALLLWATTAWSQITSPPGVIIYDEGADKGNAIILDCVGAGVSCAVSSAIATITIAGGGGAPDDAGYWVDTANASLTAERNLGALTTGLVLNTVTAGVGVPSAYTGATCTNQAVTALNASGGATCTTLTSAYVDSTIALSSITLTAGVGLSGGGDLSANRTFTFDATELGALTWGTGLAASFIWSFDLSGTDTAITFSSGAVNVSTGTLQQGGTAVVLTSRTINTTAPLGGGGALSGDLTLTCTGCLTSETGDIEGVTAGAGLSGGGTSGTVTLATDSSEAAFLASGALTCGAGTAGKVQVHTTPLQYCDNAATPALQYAAYGDSSGAAAAGVLTGTTLNSTVTASSLTSLGTIASLVATTADINAGTVDSLTSLSIRSTGTGAFDLTFANSENLTAGKTLTFAVGDTSRTLTVGASASVSGSNTGDQTITLTGDVTGSGTGSFAATIAANSVALTTDTTGDYVSSATANQGLLLTGTEGASLGFIDCAANQILKRNAGDTAWECAADATGGTPSFDAITGGTNTTAAMIVSTGASLTTSGSGTIVATSTTANAVTLGMMATGTAGNLITYSALGAPAAVATGTAAQVLTSNGAGLAPTFQAAAGGGLGYTIMLSFGSASPADSTTYFAGAGAVFNMNASNDAWAEAYFEIAKACTVKSIVYSFKVNVTGTLASGEDVAVGIRLNDTSNFATNTAARFDVYFETIAVTGLSQALVATDLIAFYVTAPVFTINPVQASASAVLYCE